MSEQAATFVTVCKTDELQPGSRMVVELGRNWVLIVNVNGEYYAIEDMCSHDEVALSEGEMIADYTIECRAHGACFDIRTGEVLAPPANVPIKRYATRVIDGDLQISARPLSRT